MKIKITKFAARQFDRKFGATKILDWKPEQFEEAINTLFSERIKSGIDKLAEINKKEEQEIEKNKLAKANGNPYEEITLTKSLWTEIGGECISIINGYAGFCRLIAIKNFTNAKVGSTTITLENYQYIRSGYSARREEELPVFSRWLELPVGKPKAEWLILVLYSKEQIESEAFTAAFNDKPFEDDELKFESDWGIVAILGQLHPNEEPMKPETMLRNALGKEEGGSGVPLDKKKYLEAVEFWSHNCTVK